MDCLLLDRTVTHTVIRYHDILVLPTSLLTNPGSLHFISCSKDGSHKGIRQPLCTLQNIKDT